LGADGASLGMAIRIRSCVVHFAFAVVGFALRGKYVGRCDGCDRGFSSRESGPIVHERSQDSVLSQECDEAQRVPILFDPTTDHLTPLQPVCDGVVMALGYR